VQVLILAGGLGTRMRPVTHTIPKALIPVNGRPFAFHQLELLKQHGIIRATFSIGFKGEQIEQAVGDGRAFGLRVDYVDEGPELVGTGGAVRLAYDRGALEEVFFVLYGDSYLPIDYQAPWSAFAQSEAPALMTVFRNQGQFDRSNARFAQGKVFYDKQAAAQGQSGFDYIDYGLSILRRQTVQAIPAGTKTDLAQLFHSLSLQDQLMGYEVKERFYEAGSPEGLLALEQFVSRGKSISTPGN
jgi:NDP-sugar pyrophosphorylase family protein